MRPLLLFVLLCPVFAHADEVQEPAGFWTGPINSEVPATISGGTVIHAAELAKLIEKDASIVVIDVSNRPKRPEGMAADAPWLPLPQEVIPGSHWVPGAGVGAIDAEIDKFFRDHLARATGGDMDHPVVIYCHENCWLSWNGAKRAIGYGYRKVYWFPEGVEGWRAAGFTTVHAKPLAPPRSVSPQ